MAVDDLLMKKWAFITCHGLGFLFIAKNPKCTKRQLSSAVHITERIVYRILKDLEEGGYISHQKTVRRAIYKIKTPFKFSHELTNDCIVEDPVLLLSRRKEEPANNFFRLNVDRI
jgi:predicted transcriptional regulator